MTVKNGKQKFQRVNWSDVKLGESYGYKEEPSLRLWVKVIADNSTDSEHIFTLEVIRDDEGGARDHIEIGDTFEVSRNKNSPDVTFMDIAGVTGLFYQEVNTASQKEKIHSAKRLTVRQEDELIELMSDFIAYRKKSDIEEFREKLQAILDGKGYIPERSPKRVQIKVKNSE